MTYVIAEASLGGGVRRGKGEVEDFDPNNPDPETQARWAWNEERRLEECRSCEFGPDHQGPDCPDCPYGSHWRG